MTYIFLHIPKCAGTSITQALPKEDTLVVHNEKDLIRHYKGQKFIAGHLTFGVHRLIKGPSRYFTSMRAPEERLSSLASYEANTPSLDPQPKDNAMTRVIGGLTDNNGLELEDLVGRTKLLQAALHRACRNLTGFEGVVFVDNFGKYLKNLGEKLGVELEPLQENVNPKHFYTPTGSFERETHYDNQLYEYAKRLFGIA
jgi:hypothetical protein